MSAHSGPNGSLEDNGDYLPLEVLGDEDSENHVCEDVIDSLTNKHVECLARFSNNELLAKDSIGQNSLHMAARVGDLNILKYLLDRLPELRDIQSTNGETAAHISAAHGGE
uniref:ANK_REP_REGION domain-containing protein n=1 Tax=Caenorhabditis japonica TaxID=281687 RepID=A0A8R1ETJ8_CAEJA